MSRQNKYNLENMTTVSARFKNDFVEDFKAATSWLNASQANIIREAMQATIIKAREEMYKDVNALIEEVSKQLDRCKASGHEEAVQRYTNFIETIETETRKAIEDHLNVYVIQGHVYITNGSRMGDGIASYIKKGVPSETYMIVCPRTGKEVFIEKQSNPVYEIDQ